MGTADICCLMRQNIHSTLHFRVAGHVSDVCYNAPKVVQNPPNIWRGNAGAQAPKEIEWAGFRRF